MRPDEIVVGGVYRGKRGCDREVLEIEGEGKCWNLVTYRRLGGKKTKDRAVMDWFAKWATERLDQPVSEGEK